MGAYRDDVLAAHAVALRRITDVYGPGRRPGACSPNGGSVLDAEPVIGNRHHNDREHGDRQHSDRQHSGKEHSGKERALEPYRLAGTQPVC